MHVVRGVGHQRSKISAPTNCTKMKASTTTVTNTTTVTRVVAGSRGTHQHNGMGMGDRETTTTTATSTRKPVNKLRPATTGSCFASTDTFACIGQYPSIHPSLCQAICFSLEAAYKTCGGKIIMICAWILNCKGLSTAIGHTDAYCMNACYNSGGNWHAACSQNGVAFVPPVQCACACTCKRTTGTTGTTGTTSSTHNMLPQQRDPSGYDRRSPSCPYQCTVGLKRTVIRLCVARCQEHGSSNKTSLGHTCVQHVECRCGGCVTEWWCRASGGYSSQRLVVVVTWWWWYDANVCEWSYSVSVAAKECVYHCCGVHADSTRCLHTIKLNRFQARLC